MPIKKTNILFISKCLTWSQAMVTLYLQSSSHVASHSRRFTSSTWTSYCLPGSRGRQTTVRPYVQQQDSVPWHSRKRKQSGLSINFCNHISSTMWSPNYPVWNPLAYYVWGAVEPETIKIPCHTKRELKVSITAVETTLNIGKANRRFRIHLKVVIEANGGFFELI